MATRNTTDGKRVGFRSPIKEPEAYFIPVNNIESNVSSKFSPSTQTYTSPTTIRSADITTPRTEVATPARRIVVIRNTKNPELGKGPVDLSEIGRSNSAENQPIISDGHKSIYVIRRPITHSALQKSIDSQQPTHETTPTTYSLEHIRTPTPPTEILTTIETSHSPSPPSSPSTRPKSPTSSIHPEKSPRYAPYLRRPRSKPRTPSPIHTNSIHRSSSPKQEEPKDINRKRNFLSSSSKKTTIEQIKSPSPVVIDAEQQAIQYYLTSAATTRTVTPPKKVQRKKSASLRSKSSKSVVLVNPEDQAIVVVENSNVKGESLRPIVKRPKSIKKTRFQDEIDDDSTEKLVKTSRSQTCLNCLSRCICLIIIICFILIIIGLAGVGVSAYFLATDSSTNLIPKIVGIAVGGVLAIAAFCFLYIVLGCIGARDGYFTYNGDGPHTGGRAFALIPPSHPNARHYIPSDYMKIVENTYPPSHTQISTTSTSNIGYGQTLLTTKSHNQQQLYNRSNSTINNYENKSIKNNITIEMPERLVTGRRLSPKSRERNLNKVVKDIGYIVEDAKKRYNGDIPNKVIVKVDEHAMQTA